MSLPEESGEFASFASDFAPEQYNRHHYAALLGADARVAAFVMRTIATELTPRFGQLESLFEIGNAGTLRTAALAEPLLAADATVMLTDVGALQLQAARSAVASVRQGELGMWSGHQTAMTAVDNRWREAVSRLCAREVGVTYHDIQAAPVPPARVRVEGHTLCSHTSDPAQYRQSLENFTASMTPGDVAIRLFDVRSTQYSVASRRFPGHPIDAAVVQTEAAELGLTVLGVDEFAVDVVAGDGEATRSTFSALGGAVLLKAATVTVIA